MTDENKNVSKVLGSLAGKMIKLAHTGAKKLEDYANKSAEENKNENAKKLASVMHKITTNLENKQEDYVAGVEKNAADLVKLGKETFGKVKQVCGEMKTRAEVAKEKAEQDSAKEDDKAEKLAADMVAQMKASTTQAEAVTEEAPAEPVVEETPTEVAKDETSTEEKEAKK